MSASAVAFALLLSCGLLSAASAAVAWRRRDAMGCRSLVAIMGASAVWNLAYALEVAAPSPHLRELWGSAKYIGVAVLPPAWLVFTIQYAGRRVRPRLLAALAVAPAVELALLAAPGTRHLVRAYAPGDAGSLPTVELGPLFWPFFAYSVVVAGSGTVPLVVRLLRTSQLYRRQVRLILAAVSLVIAANLASNLGLWVFRRFDPTPVALAASGLLVLWGIVRFRLLELLPVARTTLVETMADAVLVVDAQRRVVDLNPAAQRVVGPAASVVGRPIDDVLGDEPCLAGPAPARRELVLPGEAEDRHYELLRSPLDDERAGHVGDLLVLRDITERKQAEQRLAHLAHHDPLTGLPNRALFADRMEQALANARRTGGRLAVLFMDLDQFKVINDGLGHDIGDRVLVEVARRLGRAVRAGDTLARLGGDEFSLILPSIQAAEDGAVVAAKLLREVTRPLEIDHHVLHVSASIGIAVFPHDGRDQRTLLSRADAAMYVAKARGPGSHEFSSAEIQARAQDRQRLEAQLRRALQRGELFLEYQPLVDLASGTVLGFESLVRWDHPDLGVLPPERFIRWAEEMRLVGEIDRWALGEACRHAASWAAGDERGVISVNLSPVTVGDPDLPGRVSDALRDSGLDPRRLCLELNERTLIDDDGLVADRLGALRAMGAAVALDDFGVGHTSLHQIRRLPLDLLKIDRSFIGALGGADDDTQIVAAIVNVAHIMGLDVLAEGVERVGQLSVLRELGCDKAQGFLFAGALSAERARAMAGGRAAWPAELALGG